MRSSLGPISTLCCFGLVVGCGDSVAGSGGSTSSATVTVVASSSDATAASTGVGGAGGSGGAGGQPDPCFGPDLALEDLGAGADPENGDFTMVEALADLPAGPGPLRAIIDTDQGIITCQLSADVAPKGVANFIGLARGRRPFVDPKTPHHWIKGRKLYDGLLFHRVIQHFVAQGGDPKGNGTGGPGYDFADEIGMTLKHVPGTLAYANHGPNTNGSQFYIVSDTALPNLDGGYTIFGQCDPVSVVKKITEVPTDANDKPITPVPMKSMKITRCAP